MGVCSALPEKEKRVGRKVVCNREDFASDLEQLQMGERGSICDIADKMGVSKTQTHVILSDKTLFVPHASSLKPILEEHHKLSHALHAANCLVERPNGVCEFDSSCDKMQVDEKWFNLTPEVTRMCMTSKEKTNGKEPPRRTKSKQFVLKVMFLTCVARPRFDSNGNCTFDGKIGIWPFVDKVRAKRSSKNCPEGTLITQTINVTKDIHKTFLLEKVLPTARGKWPQDERSREVIHVGLQQDNPNTHMKDTDPDWIQAACNGRVQFHLREQPSYSPDTNVLDLGFFRSLQMDCCKPKRAKDIDDPIKNVVTAWNNCDPRKLARVWLIHQTVCNAILENNGCNDFTIPHINKTGLEREGNLPDCLEASAWAIQIAQENLEI